MCEIFLIFIYGKTDTSGRAKVPLLYKFESYVGYFQFRSSV